MKKKSNEEHRANIHAFVNEHKLIFEDEGECGFFRECVGLIGRNGCYVDYNIIDPNDKVLIGPDPKFYDERFEDIAPEDAYHKHDCVAVLGRGEDGLRKLNVEVVEVLNKPEPDNIRMSPYQLVFKVKEAEMKTEGV